MSNQPDTTVLPGSLRADLHMHSRESDGRFSPTELVSMAVNNGLELISLTDHDTMSGIDDARRRARELGCSFVNGVEVEATLEDDNGEFFGIHILGYGVDPNNEDLKSELKRIRDLRVDRAREIHDRLETLNVSLSFERIRAQSEGKSLSRVHIAQVLKQEEEVETINEAFDRYLANGKPAYVPKAGPGPEELIRLIHEAGGAAVWAHPYYSGRDSYIERLVEAGLDGIETRHSEFSKDTERRYQRLAKEYDLFVTGGSDFHGTLEETFSLGDWWIDVSEVPFPLSVTP